MIYYLLGLYIVTRKGEIYVKCPNCGAENDNNVIHCEYCNCYIKQEEPQPNTVVNQNIYINNTSNFNNTAQNQPVVNVIHGKKKNKWLSLILCIFFGFFGAHKFYEGKTGMGILYIFTAGLFCIGWIADIVALCTKPNPYYV